MGSTLGERVEGGGGGERMTYKKAVGADCSQTIFKSEITDTPRQIPLDRM
jgi:hypothetical protein